MTKYNKAIMAILGGVATLGGLLGLDVDPELISGAGSLLTALLVWWVPNRYHA